MGLLVQVTFDEYLTFYKRVLQQREERGLPAADNHWLQRLMVNTQHPSYSTVKSHALQAGGVGLPYQAASVNSRRCAKMEELEAKEGEGKGTARCASAAGSVAGKSNADSKRSSSLVKESDLELIQSQQGVGRHRSAPAHTPLPSPQHGRASLPAHMSHRVPKKQAAIQARQAFVRKVSIRQRSMGMGVLRVVASLYVCVSWKCS